MKVAAYFHVKLLANHAGIGKLNDMSKTLQQIAEFANASVSTVSRALNGHPGISKGTTAKVYQAAEQLSYRPPRSHRRLDAGRCLSKANIGVIALGMHSSLVALPAVASAISGAEAALSEAGAAVQIAHVPILEKAPSSLLNKPLDGVILAGAMQGEMLCSVQSKLMDRLRNLPTVWLLGRPVGCWGDAVASDDYATGTRAAEYLVSRGHRRLAFINPKPDHQIFRIREDGFVAAARRLDACVECFCEAPSQDWTLPLHLPDTVDVVQDLVDRMIETKPRPTAVFAAADSVAALVYRALSVRRLRVGEDISVISGNNDASLIQCLHPHLTTFDIHASELGRLAVRQLATQIAFPGEFPTTCLTLPPTLLEKNSVVKLN